SSQATNFCPAGVSGTFTWPEHGAETHSSHRTSTALTRIAIRPMRYSFLTVNLPLRTALTTALKGRRAAVALWNADGVARRCDVRRQVFERSSGVRDRLLVRQPRFERGTFGSGGRRSIQLSYWRVRQVSGFRCLVSADSVADVRF